MKADAAHLAAGGRRKPRERSGRPQSAQIDQTILKAALDVLADVGFDALSLAEVARRAGSSIPAIYRRYDDKLQLVMAALRSELAELPAGVADTGNLRDDLVGMAQRIAAALTARRARLFAAIVLARRDHPELLAFLADELHRLAATECQEAVARAAGRGELPMHAVASSVVTDIPGAYLLGRALLDGEPPGADHLQALVDTVLLPALMSSCAPADPSRTAPPMSPPKRAK